MKKLFLLLLLVLIAIQLAVPFQMILSRQTVLRKGESFRFITRPIDPADPFQGRYVRLGIKNDYVPHSKGQVENIKRKTAVYALLGTNENGFAEFTAISQEKPDGEFYLRTRYLGRRSRWNPETGKNIVIGDRIEIPFDRFYMEESKAPRAERLAAAASRSTNCWVNVRIYKGKAVIADVFAEGISLTELAEKKDE